MAKQIVQEYFNYSVEFLALVHATTVTNNITIQADADFIIAKTMMDARTAAASTNQPTPYGTVLLIDTGSGRQLMDIPCALTVYFGNAQNPYILPQAKRIAAASTLQVQVTNKESATDYDLRLTFSGFKQYFYEQDQTR